MENQKDSRMNLTKTLKFFAIALLVEAISEALKHPLYYLCDEHIFNAQLSKYIHIYYEIWSIWIQLAFYIGLSMSIKEIDSASPYCKFGRYFIYDMILVAINAIFVTYVPEYIEDMRMTFGLKIIIEIVAMLTAFFAGFQLYKDMPLPEMGTIRNGYWLLSFRHLVYAGIITTDVIICLTGKSMSEINSDTTSIITSWILLMPLLIASRYYIYKGVSDYKRNRDIAEKKLELQEV